MESPLNQAHKFERKSERALRRGDVEAAIDHLTAAIKQLDLSASLCVGQWSADSIRSQREYHAHRVKLLRVILRKREEAKAVKETMFALRAKGDDPVDAFYANYSHLVQLLDVLESSLAPTSNDAAEVPCPSVRGTSPSTHASSLEVSTCPPPEATALNTSFYPHADTKTALSRAREYLEQMKASFELLASKNRELVEEFTPSANFGGRIVTHGSDDEVDDDRLVTRSEELGACSERSASTGLPALPSLEDPDFEDISSQFISSSEEDTTTT